MKLSDYCSGAYSNFLKISSKSFQGYTISGGGSTFFFLKKLTDKHKLRPRCVHVIVRYICHERNVMTQKVVFARTTPPPRKNWSAQMRPYWGSCAIAKKLSKQLLPTGRLLLRNTVFVAFLRWGGGLRSVALVVSYKYLVFQSEIFVFTDQKIYIDIGNKGTRCLAQADWTSPEDGLCGKAPPCWYIGVF